MYENKYGLKFGCDPELFAIRSEYVPLIDDYNKDLPFAISPATMSTEVGFVPLDKELKHPLYLEGDYFKIVGDGVAYEINLKGPCNSPAEMWEKVNIACMHLNEKLISFGCNLYKKPTINFDYKKYWKEDMDENSYEYWSTIFGCDEDKDVFNFDSASRIEDVSHHPFRYGGGHLHFSGDEDIEKYPLATIKLLALTVGNYINSKNMFPSMEKMRALYYGKPGKYRIQKYPDGTTGVEYRTPSNGWLNYNYDDFERAFEYVNHALYLLKHPKEGQGLLSNYGLDTISAISTADKKLSAEIINVLNI